MATAISALANAAAERYDQLMENGALQKIFDLLERLRAPDGCPWDRAQKPEDILSALVEEAYELQWAHACGERDEVFEEMGDVLFVACFAISLLKENDPAFTLDKLTSHTHDKIKRRHPHVFGDSKARTEEEGLAHWNRIKAEEKQTRKRTEGALGDIPGNSPPLRSAELIQRRAARVGFDWPDAAGVIEKIREELSELERTLESAPAERKEEEMGDLLFSVVNLCRFLDIDGDKALAGANAKFIARFRKMERLIHRDGHRLETLGIDDLEAYWQKAKRR